MKLMRGSQTGAHEIDLSSVVQFPHLHVSPRPNNKHPRNGSKILIPQCILVALTTTTTDDVNLKVFGLLPTPCLKRRRIETTPHISISDRAENWNRGWNLPRIPGSPGAWSEVRDFRGENATRDYGCMEFLFICHQPPLSTDRPGIRFRF